MLDTASVSSARQQHTAALLRISASRIENGLIRAGHARRSILPFHPCPENLDTMSAGMPVLDADCRVHAVNQRGTMVLTGLDTRLGAPTDRIFEDGFDWVAARLVQGETLRLRDRFGSVVSMHWPCCSPAPPAARWSLPRN